LRWDDTSKTDLEICWVVGKWIQVTKISGFYEFSNESFGSKMADIFLT
jgi:hypothetical protein